MGEGEHRAESPGTPPAAAPAAPEVNEIQKQNSTGGRPSISIDEHLAVISSQVLQKRNSEKKDDGGMGGSWMMQSMQKMMSYTGENAQTDNADLIERRKQMNAYRSKEAEILAQLAEMRRKDADSRAIMTGSAAIELKMLPPAKLSYLIKELSRIHGMHLIGLGITVFGCLFRNIVNCNAKFVDTYNVSPGMNLRSCEHYFAQGQPGAALVEKCFTDSPGDEDCLMKLRADCQDPTINTVDAPIGLHCDCRQFCDVATYGWDCCLAPVDDATKGVLEKEYERTSSDVDAIAGKDFWTPDYHMVDGKSVMKYKYADVGKAGPAVCQGLPTARFFQDKNLAISSASLMNLVAVDTLSMGASIGFAVYHQWYVIMNVVETTLPEWKGVMVALVIWIPVLLPVKYMLLRSQRPSTFLAFRVICSISNILVFMYTTWIRGIRLYARRKQKYKLFLARAALVQNVKGFFANIIWIQGLLFFSMRDVKFVSFTRIVTQIREVACTEDEIAQRRCDPSNGHWEIGLAEIMLTSFCFSIFLPVLQNMFAKYVQLNVIACELISEGTLKQGMYFESVMVFFNYNFDAFRYLLLRIVLMKMSSQWIFMATVFKDTLYQFFHFGLKYTESMIVFSAMALHPLCLAKMSHSYRRICRMIEYSVRCMGIPKRCAMNFTFDIDYRRTLDPVLGSQMPETIYSSAIAFANMKIIFYNLPRRFELREIIDRDMALDEDEVQDRMTEMVSRKRSSSGRKSDDAVEGMMSIRKPARQSSVWHKNPSEAGGVNRVRSDGGAVDRNASVRGRRSTMNHNRSVGGQRSVTGKRSVNVNRQSSVTGQRSMNRQQSVGRQRSSGARRSDREVNDMVLKKKSSVRDGVEVEMGDPLNSYSLEDDASFKEFVEGEAEKMENSTALTGSRESGQSYDDESDYDHIDDIENNMQFCTNVSEKRKSVAEKKMSELDAYADSYNDIVMNDSQLLTLHKQYREAAEWVSPVTSDIATFKQVITTRINAAHDLPDHTSTRHDAGVYNKNAQQDATLTDTVPFGSAVVNAMRRRSSLRKDGHGGQRWTQKMSSVGGRRQENEGISKMQSETQANMGFGKVASEAQANQQIAKQGSEKAFGKESSVQGALAKKGDQQPGREGDEQDETPLDIEYAAYLPSLCRQRVPGWLMTTAGVPVSEEELLLLEGVVETVQTYMFMRFQVRILSKLWVAIAFFLYPLLTGMSTARTTIGTVDLFQVSFTELFVDFHKLPLEVAVANKRFLAALCFLICDVSEILAINLNLMLYESRNPVKKVTIFNMLVNMSHWSFAMVSYFQWMMLYMGVQTSDPYNSLNLRDHLSNNINFPNYIAAVSTSSQFRASRMVPESFHSLERLIARRYEVCDNDGRHSYADYPMFMLDNKHLVYQNEVIDTIPDYSGLLG